MPAEAFRDPFERLTHTHRRIEERLQDLQRGADMCCVPGERYISLATVREVLGFFGRAGARHHEDEEQSLFPRLRGLPAFAELVVTLEEQHRAHEMAFDELNAAMGRFHDGMEAELSALVRRFADLYRAHILVEERELFPRAARELDPTAITEMAEEMEARRHG